MNFQFPGAVNLVFPGDERPDYMPTFCFEGIAVSWSAAPTTSEEIRILHTIPDFDGHEFLLRDYDPSGVVQSDWFYSLNTPISIPVDEYLKVTYPNTDGNTVTIKLFGKYF